MNTDGTPILRIGQYCENVLYIKRDDLYPFSFGGNKARKAELFFHEIDNSDYDCVVTYGSSSSNHCRVISNMAAARNMPCYIISPIESTEETFNRKMMLLFGAKIEAVPLSDVHNAIENKLNDLKKRGQKPYFIPGGGHGNIGTQAYVNCYGEIKAWESKNYVHFDYIFHASGTGTTQAGLVCGKLLNGDKREIIGISIARKSPRGRDVIIESIKDYFASIGTAVSDASLEDSVVFCDLYVSGGYGLPASNEMIDRIMSRYGIPLDLTYTGKAFGGMTDYIKTKGIRNQNILFIHTGGTPLFFDYLRKTDKDMHQK